MSVRTYSRHANQFETDTKGRLYFFIDGSINWATDRNKQTKTLQTFYCEGSRPEWNISSTIYSRDIPFWSETRHELNLPRQRSVQLCAKPVGLGVSVMWLCETVSLICTFCLTVVACRSVRTGSSQRYTLHAAYCKQALTA